MKKNILCLFVFLLILAVPAVSCLGAEKPVRLIATVVLASNEGEDFDLDNDAYRNKLLELFSYTAYEQLKEYSASLTRGERQVIQLPEDYELLLTLQDKEKKRLLVQAVIRKGREIFLDTVLAIPEPGVVFLGGPSINGSDLIIILENLVE